MLEGTRAFGQEVAEAEVVPGEQVARSAMVAEGMIVTLVVGAFRSIEPRTWQGWLRHFLDV